MAPVVAIAERPWIALQKFGGIGSYARPQFFGAFGIVVFNNDFFNGQGAAVFAGQGADEAQIAFGVEHCGVLDGFVGHEYAQWQEHGGADPYTLPNGHLAVACKAVAGVVDNIVENEEQN